MQVFPGDDEAKPSAMQRWVAASFPVTGDHRTVDLLRSMALSRRSDHGTAGAAQHRCSAASDVRWIRQVSGIVVFPTSSGERTRSFGQILDLSDLRLLSPIEKPRWVSSSRVVFRSNRTPSGCCRRRSVTLLLADWDRRGGLGWMYRRVWEDGFDAVDADDDAVKPGGRCCQTLDADDEQTDADADDNPLDLLAQMDGRPASRWVTDQPYCRSVLLLLLPLATVDGMEVDGFFLDAGDDAATAAVGDVATETGSGSMTREGFSLLFDKIQSTLDKKMGTWEKGLIL
ncbi:hypothetical protein ACLOJK_007698 [Asimina triloba]